MIRNLLVFLVGLVIYAGYGLPGLAYLLASTFFAYAVGRLLPKRRFLFWPWLVLNTALLLLLRLQEPLGFSFFSVMGISYFTLQLISYEADIYRGKYGPEADPLAFALYVTYLPHLFVGPIERYDGMKPSIMHPEPFTWDGVLDGALRTVWGAAKKLLIANRLSVVVGAIAADMTGHRGAFALAAMFLYAVQLYADFSGGIDMVLGVSRILGYRLSENFDAPYFSETIQEFWRRWHITLGTFLRDYVYIPLGGNRKGKARKILNTVITFFVSGLWHGVHYLLWGFLNGLLVASGNLLKTRCRWLNRCITFVLISFLWSFFIWPDTQSALSMIGSIFTGFDMAGFAAGVGTLGLGAADWIVLGASTVLLFIADGCKKRLKSWLSGCGSTMKLSLTLFLGLAVLVLGTYGLGFSAGDFIYSRF